MFDFLDKLRAKPEPVRRVIALGTVSGMTFLISLVWFSTLGTRLSADDSVMLAKESPSPMESIGQTASAFWGNVTTSFDKGTSAFTKVTHDTKESAPQGLRGASATGTAGSMGEGRGTSTGASSTAASTSRGVSTDTGQGGSQTARSTSSIESESSSTQVKRTEMNRMNNL